MLFQHFEFDYSTLDHDGTLESNTQTVDAQTISLSEDNGGYKFLLDENTFLGQLVQAAMPLLMERDNLSEIIQQMPAITKFISTDFWDEIPKAIEQDNNIKYIKEKIAKLENKVPSRLRPTSVRLDLLIWTHTLLLTMNPKCTLRALVVFS